MNEKWERYYKITSVRKVHPILEQALEYVDSPGLAYDMGEGAGFEVKVSFRTKLDSSRR